ncbi:Rhodanese-like domain containing protein [Trichomonas vaginalis G3]|uniref:protein-tyrosine-phosphatase n=1 Tax=Trichomonas vaginalis (strain ATCC PRA-98 / G3) TaxID=412133 RepID=A2DC06_TRIV3|nr:positive regulation of cell cycle G2/M phase transition [Trichomonas vaginalis G3]EAY22047.1 Rhodanese-like domain containing protein [Trichomonas vaginalis G3]KAI5525326.1 positive regulation of cell cycle G2/M phase transition [Trichomonas vaginalis G3]|eukprot:XP_001583033.1 Rhodanese-like domain containing protein [Trichomonas vaginalis G3]
MFEQRRIRPQASQHITFKAANDIANNLTHSNNSNTKQSQTISFRYDENLIPVLPKQCPIKRISCHTMHDLLAGKYSHTVQEIEIFDCRYRYEYDGGHIDNAMHVSSLEEIDRHFFTQPKFRPNSVFIFHCEFSVNRGPDCAEYLRNTDRQLNLNKYPFIYYPHVYILDGGYSNFYKMYPEDCDGGYTPMLDSEHCENGDLAQSTTQHRKNFKLSKNNHTSSLSSFSSSLFVLVPNKLKRSPLSATLPCASTPSLLTEDYQNFPNNNENEDCTQNPRRVKKFGRSLQFDCSESSDDGKENSTDSSSQKNNDESDFNDDYECLSDDDNTIEDLFSDDDDEIDDRLEFDVEVDPFN